jgi:hypothetical protein
VLSHYFSHRSEASSPTLHVPKQLDVTNYGLSLLNMDTATFQVPSAWRFKILRNLPCSVGFVPVMENVPTW